MPDTIEKITGKISGVRTETKDSQKTGKPYTKTFLKIDGVEYNKFGSLVDKVGDVVTIEYVVSKYGNDIRTIGPASSEQTANAESKPRSKMDDFQTDLMQMQARKDSVNFALIYHVNDKDVTIKSLLDTAEKIEAHLLRQDFAAKEARDKSAFAAMVELVVSRVQGAKDPVPCEKVDKYFLIDAESRERIYTAAEKTLHVKRENGRWFDLAKCVDSTLAEDVDGESREFSEAI